MEGERILIPERMIVSPADGVFRMVDNNGDMVGKNIEVNDVIGYVETVGKSVEILSPFTGTLRGLIAHDGERLRQHEPVAWLRMHAN
jgi:hypothetical protein